MSKVVYVDMDNVLVDFRSGIARVPEHVRKEYDDVSDVPGIFALMDPMPGAVDAFHELSGLFDTYILSTAPWKNPSAWTDKRLWVEQYLGHAAHKRLILSHHKQLNRGHFLIDDRPNNGARHFRGEVIKFGLKQYDDWSIKSYAGWPEVLAYLRTQV